ncbi:MAG TPA: hypothetical protein PLR57_04790 [Clostridia bacterium]|nr:hypothetical protein [Clostridia bacterium]
MDMQAKKIILGNHEHDAPGGLFDVPRWGKVMRPILEKNPNVSVINSNLDVSAYPEYAGLTKPYVIEEVMAPWGKTKVATISKAQVREIAELKMPDLNAANVETAMSMIAGTARSMGVIVAE